VSVHEYSIVSALLEKATAEARAHHAQAIARLEVRIGEQSGVEIDLLRKAFETFREPTLAAHAELAVVPVPVRWGCADCNIPIERGSLLRCPMCGGPAQLFEGDEIVLDRIELEVADV
jgi:hydrogenase nickel incorporation protein HypA/HybF